MSFQTVTGRAVKGLPYSEAQSCLTPALANSYYLFFLSGTSTPANVYEDGALSTPFPLTGLVAADNYGRFHPIYLDSSIIYKVQFYDNTNTLRWTINAYTPPLATTGTSSNSAYGMNIASTGEVTIRAPNTGGSGISLTLKAGALGSAPLQISTQLAGSGASALIINNSAIASTHTATFVATNKPGNATSSPAGWLPITCDGVQYYTPIWHGNNFTPYSSTITALGESIHSSSVTFSGSGLTTATGAGTATPGSWYIPNTAGIGASYYINITKTGGLSGLAFSVAQGAWINIGGGLGQTITSNAQAPITGTYQISPSITGSPVVANGTITLSGNNGPQSPNYSGLQSLQLFGNGTASFTNGVVVIAAPSWYTPTSAGVGLGYYILITQTGGTVGCTFSAATGAYANIGNTSLTIGINGGVGSSYYVTGTYIIATDTGGVTQFSSGTITLYGGVNVQSTAFIGNARLVLAGNGTATLNGVSVGNWYSPTTPNIGSGYWFNISGFGGGTNGINFTAGQGEWANIGANGLIIGLTAAPGDFVGQVIKTGVYSISNNSTGNPVLGTNSLSLAIPNNLTVLHVYTTVVTGLTEFIPQGTTTAQCEVWGGGGGGAGAIGGAGGLAYSSYVVSGIGGVGKTFTYTVPPGGAAGVAGSTGSIVAGTVTGFTTMTANGGAQSVGTTPGAGGSAVGGNQSNTTGTTGSTVGLSGHIAGDGSPYGGGGRVNSAAANGAVVFYYT